MDIRKIYLYALQREHEGKRFFVENASRLTHAAAVGAFQRLAGEEQKHIEFIQLQLDALDRGESAILSVDQPTQGLEIFARRAGGEKIEDTVAESMVADLPVLRMAYLIERDFSEFYEAAANEAEGEAKQVLSMLALWERSHERLFKYMHDQAFQEYTQMPWGG